MSKLGLVFALLYSSSTALHHSKPWPLSRVIAVYASGSSFTMASYSESPVVDEKCLAEVAFVEQPLRQPSPSIRQRIIVHFLPAVLLTIALLLLVRSTFTCHGGYSSSADLRSPSSLIQEVMETEKVALEAHIMSKCPDAKACLEQLVVPTMEQVSDKVDFKISYIGR